MNAYELILEKVNDLAPGQILQYFNFYIVQEEESFITYKSNDNTIIFVFRAANDNIYFVENIEFRTLDKLDLFLSLVNDYNLEHLKTIIFDIVSIDEYKTFGFTKSITAKQILNAYFNLEKESVFENTSLANLTFTRNGKDCVLFKEKEKVIDLVVFDQNDNAVYSEFGNNFGSHMINNDSNKLLISYNPSLIQDIHYATRNILLLKYFFNVNSLLNVIFKSSYKEIIFINIDVVSSFFKLRAVLSIYSMIDSNKSFYVIQSPNNKFNEINVNFKGNLDDKIEFSNHFSRIKNTIKKKVNDAPGSLKDKVMEQFNIKVSVLSNDDNHFANVVFKNGQGLNNEITTYFVDLINRSKLDFNIA